MIPIGHNVIKTINFQIYISQCPRCKESHDNLDVERISTNNEVTHKAQCPKYLLPILLQININQVF